MEKIKVCFSIFLFMASSILYANPEEPAPENVLAKEKEKVPALKKRESLRIHYYKPMYLAYGEPATKIQLSFRAPLSENIPINFAYSQIIFWELKKHSKPFQDATYNPEFFYRHSTKSRIVPTIDFGMWEHNSNGKDGLASRSYDQVYTRANFAFEGQRWITLVSLKLRYIYNPDKTNAALRQYISPLELQVKFLQLFDHWVDTSEVYLDLNPGGDWANRWDRGGYSVGASFRLGGLKIIPAFYLQYYHGYAETLVNFNEKVDEFRAGFLF